MTYPDYKDQIQITREKWEAACCNSFGPEREVYEMIMIEHYREECSTIMKWYYQRLPFSVFVCWFCEPWPCLPIVLKNVMKYGL